MDGDKGKLKKNRNVMQKNDDAKRKIFVNNINSLKAKSQR
jgi:hypothetical protein